MFEDVWRTLFTSGFDTSEYLYHYTDFESALKIIHSQGFLFSKITSSNDTIESKLKITFTSTNKHKMPSSDERVKVVSEYYRQNCDFIRSLCFSQDALLTQEQHRLASEMHPFHERDKYYDVSGRGFALPRMWAQYGSNNKGVCFIIAKDRIDERIKRVSNYIISGPITYRDFFDHFNVSEEELNRIYTNIKQFSNGVLSFANLIDTSKDFFWVNYFEKQSDWSNEREFRYMALADNPSTRILVDGLFDYTAGIVIGEKMEPAYEAAIQSFVNDRCDIKKIKFETRLCKVH